MPWSSTVNNICNFGQYIYTVSNDGHLAKWDKNGNIVWRHGGLQYGDHSLAKACWQHDERFSASRSLLFHISKVREAVARLSSFIITILYDKGM